MAQWALWWDPKINKWMKNLKWPDRPRGEEKFAVESGASKQWCPQFWSCAKRDENKAVIQIVDPVLSGWVNRMIGSSLSSSSTSTLSTRQEAPHSPPNKSIIKRQKYMGKAKRQMVRLERDKAREQAATITITKLKTRQRPPSLTTVIKPFQKGDLYWECLSSSACVGHYRPLSFTSILVLTNTIHTCCLFLDTL